MPQHLLTEAAQTKPCGTGQTGSGPEQTRNRPGNKPGAGQDIITRKSMQKCATGARPTENAPDKRLRRPNAKRPGRQYPAKTSAGNTPKQNAPAGNTFSLQNTPAGNALYQRIPAVVPRTKKRPAWRKCHAGRLVVRHSGCPSNGPESIRRSGSRPAVRGAVSVHVGRIERCGRRCCRGGQLELAL